MTSCFACQPIHPTDCWRGEGETVSKGVIVNLFRDWRIHSNALSQTQLPFFRLPNLKAFLILPFLKLLIGIVAHIAIFHLCVPILANFFMRKISIWNLWLLQRTEKWKKSYLYPTRRYNAISCFVSYAFRVSQRTIDVVTEKRDRAIFKTTRSLDQKVNGERHISM